MVKGRHKKKGFKGTPNGNYRDCEISKQIDTKIKDKIETQF